MKTLKARFDEVKRDAVALPVDGLDIGLVRRLYMESDAPFDTKTYTDPALVPIEGIATPIGKAYKNFLEGRYGFFPLTKERMGYIGPYLGLADHSDITVGIDIESADYNPYKIAETYAHELSHLLCETNDDGFVYGITLRVLDYLSGSDEFGTGVRALAAGAKPICMQRGLVCGYFDGEMLRTLGYLDSAAGLGAAYGGLSFEVKAGAGNNEENTLADGMINGIFAVPSFVERGVVRSYLRQFWPEDGINKDPKLTNWMEKLLKAGYKDIKNRWLNANEEKGKKKQ